MSDVKLREYNLVFVAPDGTEYPVVGRADAGVEWVVNQAQWLADTLGLALNCGIVEVQEVEHGTPTAA